MVTFVNLSERYRLSRCLHPVKSSRCTARGRFATQGGAIRWRFRSPSANGLRGEGRRTRGHSRQIRQLVRSSLRSFSNRWRKDFILARLASGTLCHPDSLVFGSLSPQDHSHGRNGEPGKSQRNEASVPGGNQSCWAKPRSPKPPPCFISRKCYSQRTQESCISASLLVVLLFVYSTTCTRPRITVRWINRHATSRAAHALASATATERSRHGGHLVWRS